MDDWLTPLYDADGMRAVDAWAIEDQGVPSLELMEAAGQAVARAAEGLGRDGPVRVVCGKGNNGGDGLVAARWLAEWGFDVDVLLLSASSELSPDAGVKLKRFEGRVEEQPDDIAACLAGSGVVIDAIFGTGFAGAPREPAAKAIETINSCAAPVVAADIASGVNAATGEVEGAGVEAATTVTFHAAKVGHWIAPGKWLRGELQVAPIGIPDGATVAPAAGLIDEAVLNVAARRDAGSTKFSSGQVVVIGGSRGLTGAVCLAALAAGRAGAGYVTVAVPDSLEPIFETKLTEAMTRGLPAEGGRLTPAGVEEALAACERAACVLLGPGLGEGSGTAALARALAAEIDAPLVVDADGLNAHAGHLSELSGRAAPTVLTPHAGELARLLDRDSAQVSAHRLAGARDAASAAGAIVVLKGDDTIVLDPAAGSPGPEAAGHVAINGLASPALATAGTGDVLGGMIAAHIARGAEPFAAACAAVLAHARAGRVAAERLGAAESVMAGDVIDAIPAALAAGR